MSTKYPTRSLCRASCCVVALLAGCMACMVYTHEGFCHSVHMAPHARQHSWQRLHTHLLRAAKSLCQVSCCVRLHLVETHCHGLLLWAAGQKIMSVRWSRKLHGRIAGVPSFLEHPSVLGFGSGFEGLAQARRWRVLGLRLPRTSVQPTIQPYVSRSCTATTQPKARVRPFGCVVDGRKWLGPCICLGVKLQSTH